MKLAQILGVQPSVVNSRRVVGGGRGGGGGGSEGGGAADDEDSSSFPTTGAVAEAKAAWCRAALALALAFFAGPR